MGLILFKYCPVFFMCVLFAQLILFLYTNSSFTLSYILLPNSVFHRSASLQFNSMCLAFSFPKRRLWFPLSRLLLDPLSFQISFFHPRFTITFTSSTPSGLLFLTPCVFHFYVLVIRLVKSSSTLSKTNFVSVSLHALV
jgi:hypothetical protein